MNTKFVTAFAALLTLGIASAAADGRIDNDPSELVKGFPSAGQSTTMSADESNSTLRAYASRNSPQATGNPRSGWHGSVGLTHDPAYQYEGRQ